MIPFLLRKIRNNKWLMLCLVFGNIILIATVSVVPLFIAATEQRLFQGELRSIQEEKNIYPALSHLRYSFNIAPDERRFADYIETRDAWLPKLVSDMGIPVTFETHSYVITSLSMNPYPDRDLTLRNRSLQITAPRDFEENISLLYGRMPSDTLLVNDGPTGGYVIEALAMNQVLYSYDLLVDELIDLEYIFGDDDSKLHMRITGIFEPAEGSGEYWSVVSSNLRTSLFISD